MRGAARARTYGYGAAALTFAMVALACEAAPEPGAEFAEEEAAPPPDDLAEPSEQGCPLLEERIGERTALGDEPVEALADIEELAWIGSALAAPQLEDERDRADGITVFAAWDTHVDGTPEEDDAETTAESADPEDEFGTDADPRSFVHLGASLELDDLLAAGQLDLADGAVLSIDQDLDGHVEVERDGQSAEVICADVPIQDGVVHIVDALLVPVDEAPLEPDTEVDRETIHEDEAP